MSVKRQEVNVQDPQTQQQSCKPAIQGSQDAIFYQNNTTLPDKTETLNLKSPSAVDMNLSVNNIQNSNRFATDNRMLEEYSQKKPQKRQRPTNHNRCSSSSSRQANRSSLSHELLSNTILGEQQDSRYLRENQQAFDGDSKGSPRLNSILNANKSIEESIQAPYITINDTQQDIFTPFGLESSLLLDPKKRKERRKKKLQLLQEREPVIVDDGKSVYKNDTIEKSVSSRYHKKLPQLSTVIDQHSSEVSMTEDEEQLNQDNQSQQRMSAKSQVDSQPPAQQHTGSSLAIENKKPNYGTGAQKGSRCEIPRPQSKRGLQLPRHPVDVSNDSQRKSQQHSNSRHQSKVQQTNQVDGPVNYQHPQPPHTVLSSNFESEKIESTPDLTAKRASEPQHVQDSVDSHSALSEFMVNQVNNPEQNDLNAPGDKNKLIIPQQHQQHQPSKTHHNRMYDQLQKKHFIEDGQASPNTNHGKITQGSGTEINNIQRINARSSASTEELIVQSDQAQAFQELNFPQNSQCEMRITISLQPPMPASVRPGMQQSMTTSDLKIEGIMAKAAQSRRSNRIQTNSRHQQQQQFQLSTSPALDTRSPRPELPQATVSRHHAQSNQRSNPSQGNNQMAMRMTLSPRSFHSGVNPVILIKGNQQSQDSPQHKISSQKSLNFAENLTRLMLSKKFHQRKRSTRLTYQTVISSENLITKLQKESAVLSGQQVIVPDKSLLRLSHARSPLSNTRNNLSQRNSFVPVLTQPMQQYQESGGITADLNKDSSSFEITPNATTESVNPFTHKICSAGGGTASKEDRILFTSSAKGPRKLITPIAHILEHQPNKSQLESASQRLSARTVSQKNGAGQISSSARKLDVAKSVAISVKGIDASEKKQTEPLQIIDELVQINMLKRQKTDRSTSRKNQQRQSRILLPKRAYVGSKNQLQSQGGKGKQLLVVDQTNNIINGVINNNHAKTMQSSVANLHQHTGSSNDRSLENADNGGNTASKHSRKLSNRNFSEEALFRLIKAVNAQDAKQTSLNFHQKKSSLTDNHRKQSALVSHKSLLNLDQKQMQMASGLKLASQKSQEHAITLNENNPQSQSTMQLFKTVPHPKLLASTISAKGKQKQPTQGATNTNSKNGSSDPTSSQNNRMQHQQQQQQQSAKQSRQQPVLKMRILRTSSHTIHELEKAKQAQITMTVNQEQNTLLTSPPQAKMPHFVQQTQLKQQTRQKKVVKQMLSTMTNLLSVPNLNTNQQQNHQPQKTQTTLQLNNYDTLTDSTSIKTVDVVGRSKVANGNGGGDSTAFYRQLSERSSNRNPVESKKVILQQKKQQLFLDRRGAQNNNQTTKPESASLKQQLQLQHQAQQAVVGKPVSLTKPSIPRPTGSQSTNKTSSGNHFPNSIRLQNALGSTQLQLLSTNAPGNKRKLQSHKDQQPLQAMSGGGGLVVRKTMGGKSLNNQNNTFKLSQSHSTFKPIIQMLNYQPRGSMGSIAGAQQQNSNQQKSAVSSDTVYSPHGLGGSLIGAKMRNGVTFSSQVDKGNLLRNIKLREHKDLRASVNQRHKNSTLTLSSKELHQALMGAPSLNPAASTLSLFPPRSQLLLPSGQGGSQILTSSTTNLGVAASLLQPSATAQNHQHQQSSTLQLRQANPYKSAHAKKILEEHYQIKTDGSQGGQPVFTRLPVAAKQRPQSTVLSGSKSLQHKKEASVGGGLRALQHHQRANASPFTMHNNLVVDANLSSASGGDSKQERRMIF